MRHAMLLMFLLDGCSAAHVTDSFAGTYETTITGVREDGASREESRLATCVLAGDTTVCPVNAECVAVFRPQGAGRYSIDAGACAARGATATVLWRWTPGEALAFDGVLDYELHGEVQIEHDDPELALEVHTLDYYVQGARR